MTDLYSAFHYVDEWFNSRSWDFYRFAGPIASLIVQYASSALTKGLANEVDRELMRQGMTASGSRNDIICFARDWHVQISYFVAFPTTVISIFTITRPSGGNGCSLFALMVLLLVVVGVWVFPRIFKQQPGDLSKQVLARDTLLERFLARRRWCNADLYSRSLRAVNVVLLVLILITMPAKPK